MKQLAMILLMLGSIALLLTACSTVTTTSPQTPKPTREETPSNKFVGTWKSASPEQNNIGQFIVRELQITPTRWVMTQTLAQDSEMSNPIFSASSEGTYVLENESQKLPGTYHIQFKFSKKSLTRKTKDRRLSKVFGLDSCKLVVDKESDVTEKGCSFIPKIADCPQEFDLIKLESNNLSLGARPQDNNICTSDRRPEALGLPLKRAL